MQPLGVNRYFRLLGVALLFLDMEGAYLKLAENIIASKKVEVFNNPRFDEIRTAIDEQGEPWFCLADVCRILELRVDGVMPRLREGGYNRIVVDRCARSKPRHYICKRTKSISCNNAFGQV